PEALELFLNHLGTLQLSLNTHEALKGFQIHLMTPILKSERSELYARGKTREERKKDANIKGVGAKVSKKMTS
ncbi:MAG: hypothetical protein KDK64_00285, partial [Chlamydiia bacterium]|nr:hypothetical protein [Chlamydiia bacterium]